MYSVSDLFKMYIAKPDRSFEVKAVIGATTYDNTKVIDFEIDDSLILNDDFTIGTAVSSHMRISIRTSDVVPSNAKIVPYVRLGGTGGYTEWVKLGEFYVDSRGFQNGVAEFSCYDILILTQQPYISTLVYPIAMSSVLNEICTFLGVTLDASVHINSSYIVKTKPIGYNIHDILAYIAMAHASSAQMTKDGKLGFIKYSLGLFRTPINPSNLWQAKQTNPTKTFTKFVCKYDAKGSTYSAGAGDADHTLTLDNPFIDQTMLNNIYSALNGFSYTPFTMDWKGFVYLEVGDLVQVLLRDGSVISSVILTNKAVFKGGLKVTTVSPSYSPQRSEFNFAGGYQEVSDPNILEVSVQDDSINIIYDDNTVSTYALTKDAQGRVTALGKSDGTITISYTDTLIAPLFQSASSTVDGNSVVVAFDHIMINPTNHQSQFTVKINGVNATILSTSQGNYSNKVSLNIYETIKSTDVVTVAYTKPVSDGLFSIQNFALESFTAQPVTNVAANPPTFVSATTNSAGTVVTVTFSKAMYNPSGEYQQFDVTSGTGGDKFPSSAALNANPTKIDITLMIPIGYGEVMTLLYNAGQLKGADGSTVLSFSGKSITNTVPATTHQVWNGYGDSPFLTSDYPYQAIGRRGGGMSDVLVYSATPIKWYMFLSSASGLKARDVSGGSYGAEYTGIESQMVSITQCNNNIVSSIDNVTVVYYKTI